MTFLVKTSVKIYLTKITLQKVNELNKTGINVWIYLSEGRLDGVNVINIHKIVRVFIEYLVQ